jgi:small-conductance mechanosensitive channel
MKNEFEKYLDNPIIDKILTVIIGVIIIWIFIKVLQKHFFVKIKGNDIRYKAKKLSSFIGYILSIVLLLIVYMNKLGEFTVAIGVASAGIAFALQEVIASFAGWLAIMFGGFYKTGERIQLGGIKGDVMDIGVLRTTLMEIGEWVDGDLYNGRIVLVANSFVFKEPVFNYSADFPFLWDEIRIIIQHGSNYEKAKLILLNIGKEISGDFSEKSKEIWNTLKTKYFLEDTQTEPMISLIANDSGVQCTLRYVVKYNKRRITKTEIFSRILKEIDATNGEIKFASEIVPA